MSRWEAHRRLFVWKEDDMIANHFNEIVWLKPCSDRDGERIGITECCFADDPCGRHSEMAKHPVERN